jgi:hypothetical protein
VSDSAHKAGNRPFGRLPVTCSTSWGVTGSSPVPPIWVSYVRDARNSFGSLVLGGLYESLGETSYGAIKNPNNEDRKYPIEDDERHHHGRLPIRSMPQRAIRDDSQHECRDHDENYRDTGYPTH